MLGAAASRPRSTPGSAASCCAPSIPFFTTQMGKGTVAGGSNLYIGTAALSERDYVHEAIDKADLIIAIGHDTIEKPPFIMGAGRAAGDPCRLHAGQRRGGLLPPCRGRRRRRAEPELLADRLEGKLQNAGALCRCARKSCARIADRAEEERFPPTPQRIVHDVRQVMPSDGIVALDNGMYKIWFARNYRTYVANTLLLDNALATMGAGCPRP